MKKMIITLIIFLFGVSFCPAESISLKELIAKVQKSEQSFKDAEFKYTSWRFRTIFDDDLERHDEQLKDTFIPKSGSEENYTLAVILNDMSSPIISDYLYGEKEGIDIYTSDPNIESRELSKQLYKTGVIERLRVYPKFNRLENGKLKVDSNSPPIRQGIVSIADGNDGKDISYQLLAPSPLGFTVLKYPIIDYSQALTISPQEDTRFLSVCMKNLGRISDTMEIVNNFKTIRVDLIVQEKIVFGQIYFAVDYDYTPVKFVLCSGSGNVEREVTSLEKINGIWIPMKGSHITYEKGSEPTGFVFEVKEAKINYGIQKDKYKITLPKNTQIDERLKHKGYKINSD